MRLTCWHPCEYFMSIGAMAICGVVSPGLVGWSRFNWLNWNRASLSSSMRRCKMPKKRSSEWFVKVGSTTFRSVLFLMSRSWISDCFSDKRRWCDAAIGAGPFDTVRFAPFFCANSSSTILSRALLYDCTTRLNSSYITTNNKPETKEKKSKNYYLDWITKKMAFETVTNVRHRISKKKEVEIPMEIKR